MMEIWELFIVGFFSVLIFAFLLRFVTRSTRRQRRDHGPWIGYTLTFTHGPEAGMSYRVKSVLDGFVVLEELEEEA